jgi:hypothetical protein
MMNEAKNNAACCSSAQTVNAPLCEEKRCSAQSAMAQAKKQTLKQPMKQLIKQSAHELAVGVTIHHRINTRKQVAHAPCSQLDLSLVQHVLHLRPDHQYAP